MLNPATPDNQPYPTIGCFHSAVYNRHTASITARKVILCVLKLIADNWLSQPL